MNSMFEDAEQYLSTLNLALSAQYMFCHLSVHDWEMKNNLIILSVFNQAFCWSYSLMGICSPFHVGFYLPVKLKKEDCLKAYLSNWCSYSTFLHVIILILHPQPFVSNKFYFVSSWQVCDGGITNDFHVALSSLTWNHVPCASFALLSSFVTSSRVSQLTSSRCHGSRHVFPTSTRSLPPPPWHSPPCSILIPLARKGSKLKTGSQFETQWQ